MWEKIRCVYVGEIAQTKIVERKYKMKKKALVYSGQFLKQICMDIVSQEYSGSLKNRCPLQTSFSFKVFKVNYFYDRCFGQSHFSYVVEYNAF